MGLFFYYKTYSYICNVVITIKQINMTKVAVNVTISFGTRLLVNDPSNLSYEERLELISLIKKELGCETIERKITSIEPHVNKAYSLVNDAPLFDIKSDDLKINFKSLNHFVNHFECQTLMIQEFGKESIDEFNDVIYNDFLTDFDSIQTLLEKSFNTQYKIDEVEYFGETAFKIVRY